MAMETKAVLNDETIKKLQRLIRANIDSYDGLNEAADVIGDQAVANLFRDLAAERFAMTKELQIYVERNGEEAEYDGSFAARIHRVWLDIRAKLSDGDSFIILIEAERGEDHIKHAYENVLKETAGSAMNDVLQSQYVRVKAGHDRIRDLRDSYESRD